MGALLPSFSSPLILRCLLRRPPPSATTTTTTTLHVSCTTPSFLKLFNHTHHSSTPSLTPPLPTFSSLIPRSLSTTTTATITTIVTSTEPDSEPDTEPDSVSETEVDDTHLIETEIENEKENENPVDARISNTHKELLSRLKSMSVKEKKELGSYANSLGKKLKSQQVGKSGVTDSVATALLETLEANELLKLKIHNNCPGELDEVVSQLEEATGSVVVGRIGRTIIIYRPSLTKLKAEEKKKQNMKVFLKRRAAFKSSYQNRTQSRGQSATPSNRRRDYRRS